MLRGKTVLLGVSSSIAAYKACGSGQPFKETGGFGPCDHDEKCRAVYQSAHF